VSVNLLGVVAFTIENQKYFIKKDKFVSYSRHMLCCTGDLFYWFVYKSYNTEVYNAVTGAKVENVSEIFEPYEVVKKDCGTVFVDEGTIYPDSKYYIRLYKVKTEYGSNLFFADGEEGTINYMSPMANGKFTKPALKNANYFD
jgi:hypothetical protein